MRFITVKDNVVISVRIGDGSVEGEIQSDTGALGQTMNQDGTFSNPELPDTPKEITVQEQLEELKKQNLILMDALATLFETVVGGV